MHASPDKVGQYYLKSRGNHVLTFQYSGTAVLS